MEHVLTILEVSQKQAYIFSSNALKDNVVNSAVIAWIMSPQYFAEIIQNSMIFDEKKNIVYSGGGHVVLEFDDIDIAKEFVQRITFQIHKDYPGIEVFAKTKTFEQQQLDTEAGDCLKKLTAELERKKSVRLSSFHQGSFGIEAINSKTLEPELVGKYLNSEMPKQEQERDKELSPKEYKQVDEFKKLGGSKDSSNFIAVVHIDGNAMGKRVENMHKRNKLPWEEFKGNLQKFSSKIDHDFKAAYKEMVDEVECNLKSGNLDKLKLENDNFPVRRIITAGDDICFVSEGRIGLECAVSFIRALMKKTNKEDHLGYAACAGVAIVHQKYPFYRAYELAESLCSNAKKFGVKWSEDKDKTGCDVSAIDWHIEFGEMEDTLEEIRRQYQTVDEHKARLEMRPYIIKIDTANIPKDEPDDQTSMDLQSADSTPRYLEFNDQIPWYSEFKKQVGKIQRKDITDARGKLKELRNVLKQGNDAAKSFVYFNKIEDIMLEGKQKDKIDCDVIASGKGMERELFVKMRNGLADEQTTTRSIVFDALEISDTYIGFEDEEEKS